MGSGVVIDSARFIGSGRCEFGFRHGSKVYYRFDGRWMIWCWLSEEISISSIIKRINTIPSGSALFTMGVDGSPDRLSKSSPTS
ncbi:hypothetical protein KCP70_14045 [Salmonella enterica subsp. enterica]|nr:hypothetical protein KCP70_14045 [Salmonella enterica subsp. enterica]